MNLKYILIVVILAVVVGGGILAYQYWWTPKQPTPPSVLFSPETWKIYINNELQFSIQYPPGILLPRSPCDSFVLAGSEEERNRIKSIRDRGIEIGYSVEGLELGFCIITPGGRSLTLDDIKNYQLQGVHTNITFVGKEAIQVKFDEFTEAYIIHPSGEIMRAWYRYGDDSYEEIAVQMLSTFRFLE